VVGRAQAQRLEPAAVAGAEPEGQARRAVPLVRPDRGLRNLGRAGRSNPAARGHELERQTGGLGPRPRAGPHPVGLKVGRELQDRGAAGRRQALELRRVRRERAIGQALHELSLAGRERPQPMLDPGPAGRAKDRAHEQTVLADHGAHGIERDRVDPEVVGEAQPGPRDVEQEQQLVGAVLVEEVVIG
jgi:hypothetical protein